MVKNRLGWLIAIFLLFSQVSLLFGQAKFTQNKEILQEVRKITKVFSDSVSHYDYKKDKQLYLEKYGTFYKTKIENLYRYYQEIYTSNLSDGKSNVKSKIPNPNQADLTIGLEDLENGEQMKELGAYLRSNFPLDLYDFDGARVYKCKLTFIVDAEGQFTRVKYKGEKLEFNLFSALFLYAIGHLERPLLYKGVPIKRQFTLPITLVSN